MRLTYIMQVMNNLKYIRTNVFKLSQAEFAAIVGLKQSAVSRWEAGTSSPTFNQVRVIREEAKRRALGWDHDWLFGNVPGPTNPRTQRHPRTKLRTRMHARADL